MEKDTTIFRLTQFIHYSIYALTGILTLRFVLQLFGANPGAAFTDLIYSLSAVFVAPFQYVFNAINVGVGTLELNTILAIVVYWLLGEALIKLVTGLRSVSHQEAKRELRHDYR